MKSAKTTTPPKSCNSQPLAVPRSRRWFLSAAIAAEAAWIVCLIALVMAR